MPASGLCRNLCLTDDTGAVTEQIDRKHGETEQ